MAYRIEIAAPAEQDIDDALAYIASHSPEAATRWYAELRKVIYSLDEMPSRFAVIPEVDALGSSYRAALYKPYRVIFQIDEAANTVFVVRVYHGARRPLMPQDFQ